jgi:hypothetical protein
MKEEDTCLTSNELIKRKFRQAMISINVLLKKIMDYFEISGHSEGDALNELPDDVISSLEFQQPETCRKDVGVFPFERRTYSVLVELTNLYKCMSTLTEDLLLSSTCYC